MIQHESIVNIADNTGVKVWLVIGIIKWNSKSASIWDTVVIAYKDVSSGSIYKKWWVGRALVVRTVKKIRRSDGSYISFNDNAVILVWKEDGQPLGKRIFWPVARELREKYGLKNVTNMAQEVI